MEKLKLNDGTVLENSHAFSNVDLFLYIERSDINTVFGLLIFPENTERIEYDAGGGPVVFNGYTKLIAVRDEGQGLITAVLRKEGTGNV